MEIDKEESIWTETIEIVRMIFVDIGYKDSLADYFLLLRIFKQIYQEVVSLREKAENEEEELYTWSAPQWWHTELLLRFLSIRFGLFKPLNCMENFPEIGSLLNMYRESEEML